MPSWHFDWELIKSLIWSSEWVLRVLAILWIPQRRSPAAAKVWLLLIFFLPWVGFVLYWLLGNVSLKQARSRKREKLLRAWAARNNALELAVAEVPQAQQERLAQAVRLAENLGRMPIVGGNHAEMLADYDESLDRLIADIDAAKQSVHLLYYIFEDDGVGQRVAQALLRAEKRGVQCRVLVDAIGSRPFRRLLPELKAEGVEAYSMLPVGLFAKRLARFDVRNHRKLAVIDGQIGHIGSQNIVDATFKPGIVNEEMVCRVTGPVVTTFQCIFADDWYLTTGRALEKANAFPDVPRTGDAYAQLLPSGPGYPTENNQRLFVAFIHAARERVVITTPYFIPDDALLQALQTAVLRGVDVRLVVPYKADQYLVGFAQRSYYDELLDSGVKVFQYRTRFLHAKHLTIDDGVAIIGSSNMDQRSFGLNLELSLILYDFEATQRLREAQERYFAGSTLLTKAEWAKRTWLTKGMQNIARLFSPLL